jgi:hypothetical protein
MSFETNFQIEQSTNTPLFPKLSAAMSFLFVKHTGKTIFGIVLILAVLIGLLVHYTSNPNNTNNANNVNNAVPTNNISASKIIN